MTGAVKFEFAWVSHLIHYRAVDENEVDRGEKRGRKERSMHGWTTQRKRGRRRNPITDQTKQIPEPADGDKKIYQRNEGIQHPRGSWDECKGKRHAPGRKPTKRKRQKAEG